MSEADLRITLTTHAEAAIVVAMATRTLGPIENPISGLITGLITGLALAGAGTSAQADMRLNVHYSISMIGVSIGQLSWATDIGANSYTTSANGKASGPLSMLVNGEGQVATHGLVKGARLIPTIFTSSVTEDGEVAGLQMTFENDAVKTLRTDEPLRKLGRIPVSEADRRGVTDPLSAMLIATPPGQDVLSPESCNRVLAIFDGQRRYNLVLSFKRMDVLKIKRGYDGPTLVCAVVLEPIAGYRADSLLVKYVGGQRNMELWLVPVSGANIVMPGRLLMPTMIGALEIYADRYETVPPQPAPASGSPAKPRQ